jgi:AAA family ATP:ADP antiporter
MQLTRLRSETFTLLQKMVDVQPGETPALLSGFCYFFTLLCSYYLLRPLRDAMGLVGGADELQWLFTLTFVAMLCLVPVFGWLVRRLAPRSFVTVVYRFFAANILLFSLLIALGVREQHVARFFFVWVSVYNLFVVSIFWSVLADRFTPAQGKRLFGFIAAGGTAGTFAGPALAAGLAGTLGPVALTLAAAVLLEISLLCCRRLLRGAHAGSADGASQAAGTNSGIGGSILGGATLILRSPYLIAIVCYMFLHTSAATFLYFEQGRIVAESVMGTAARTRFFAQVDLLVSALTLLLQLFVTGRLMRRFGVTLLLMLLPLAAITAFGLVAMWPGLLVLAIMQGVRRAADFALARPAREVLFTVLTREAKYKAKNFIDTVVYRGGDAVSGWISAGFSSLGMGFAAVAAMMLPFSLLWLWLARWLGRQQEQSATLNQPQE